MLILYFRVLRIYVNYAFNDDKFYDVDTTVMNEIRATDYSVETRSRSRCLSIECLRDNMELGIFSQICHTII
jgi:hypothetical protein